MSIASSPGYGLQETSPDEQRRHEQLLALIKQRIIAQGGMLRFDHYMQMALYEPQLGYYTSARDKFGRSGDFVTAVELAPVFNRCLAECCFKVLPTLAQKNIYEFGGGTGQMCVQILQALEQLNALPQQYYIIDVSSALREQQRLLVQQHIPHLAQRVTWLEQMPSSMSGLVIANELLDALPVRRFYISGQTVHEEYIAYKDDELQRVRKACADTRVLQRIAEIEADIGEALPAGYHSEINFEAEDWLNQLGSSLQQGVVLLIDYGYVRSVYYHPQRTQGTLICHYQQHVNDDVLKYAGLQDITAFVDFTAMARAAQPRLQPAGFATQAHWLLDLGIVDRMRELQNNDPQMQLALANQIRRLTLPHEMGESFKVLALRTHDEIFVPGFGFRDRSHELLIN